MYETPIYRMFLMLGNRQMGSGPLLWAFFIFIWSWPNFPHFFVLYTCGISKHAFFFDRKLKKISIFPLLTFHVITNNGHEYEKGGNFDNFYDVIMMIF